MTKEATYINTIKKLYRSLMLFVVSFILAGGVLVYYMYNPDMLDFNLKQETIALTPVEIDEDLIENGVHVRTGFIEAEGYTTVINNCTNCHSSKIVLQNRMSAERWNATIKWMQETQNLWDLGRNQEIIVNYLATNYPPIKKGRRMVLTNIEWYELEDK